MASVQNNNNTLRFPRPPSSAGTFSTYGGTQTVLRNARLAWRHVGKDTFGPKKCWKKHGGPKHMLEWLAPTQTERHMTGRKIYAGIKWNAPDKKWNLRGGIGVHKDFKNKKRERYPIKITHLKMERSSSHFFAFENGKTLHVCKNKRTSSGVIQITMIVHYASWLSWKNDRILKPTYRCCCNVFYDVSNLFPYVCQREFLISFLFQRE